MPNTVVATPTPPSPSASAYAAPRVDRASAASVEDVLRAEPTTFSFFQAVRLLTRLRRDRAPVGGYADPADEVVRFRSSTSLGFPASEIQALAPEPGAGPDAPPRMTVNFFGLVGPVGVLPHTYTEHASTRARAKDNTFRDFLDLFHHRVISLFYRAWAKHRAAVVYETKSEDSLHDHLLDLAGLGTAGLRGRLPIRDEAFGFYAALLASRGRPADGLARLVGDYFDVPASVEQFVGEWRRVESGGQCALGDESSAGRLGWGMLGDAAWDPQGRVRLRLGPLTREQFDAFLPSGSAHTALRALATLYAGDEVGIDAQLVLAREEVPPCTLGPSPGVRAAPPPLGRGSWLASRPLNRDPDDTSLRLC